MTSEAIEKIIAELMKLHPDRGWQRPEVKAFATELASRILEEAAQHFAELRKKRGNGYFGKDNEGWWNLAEEMEEVIRNLRFEPGSLSGVAQEEKS